MSRAIFLDRDGVLNRAIIREGRPYPPSTILELHLLPGVKEVMHALSKKGWKLIVVTNQPDVARGVLSRFQVNEINQYLISRLPIDQMKVCFHDDSDGCLCRKPKPGMLIDSARELDIDLSESFMIGDRWRDIEAGKNAGCKTIFIDHSYSEKQPMLMDFKVSSLDEAAKIILGKNYENDK